MPNVLPTIPNDPPQGIQALLDKVYLWNPDVSNELIEKINALLAKLGDAIGAIRPYSELVSPISQYEPCYYGSGVYVASRELTEIPMEFNEADWILIATKGVTAEEAAQTYLPLSGGTMTGQIDFNPAAGTASSNKALISAQTADGLKALFGAKTDENGILLDVAVIPKLQGDLVSYETILTSFIGNINTPVTRIHAKKITSSGITDAITIPAKAGTMARLEDLTGENVSVTFAGHADTVQNAINTLKTDQGGLGEQVSAIESKIPADASETNPLVTKNEVLALPTFTYKVVNELPETGEENIIYLVPKAGEGNDVHDEYIWVNSAYELIGTTAVDLSGYLPLTGGEMTGLLTLNATEKPQYFFQSAPLLQIKAETADGTTKLNKNIEITPGGFLNMAGLSLSSTGSISCMPTGDYDIGSQTIKWRRVYATKLNNGADLTVPTEGGTLARIEDINTIGGDGTAGQVLTKTDVGMAWQDATGGSSLPDQTGNAGKFLQTNGESASWAGGVFQSALPDNTKIMFPINGEFVPQVSVSQYNSGVFYGKVNPAFVGVRTNNVVAVVDNNWTDSYKFGEQSVTLAVYGSAKGERSVAIGFNSYANATRAIQLGSGTNEDANTFKVGNTNGNFEMMDASGNVPLERLTYVTNQIGDISTALTAILGE